MVYTKAASTATINVRAQRTLMIAGAKLPADSSIAVNNPCSQILAKLTGAPAPAGDVSNYLGNR